MFQQTLLSRQHEQLLNLKKLIQNYFRSQQRRQTSFGSEKHTTITSSEETFFEQQLDKSSISKSFNFSDDGIAQKLHKNKYNKRITPISEFSNAVHNGRVFKNP